MLESLQKELRELSDKEKAVIYARFFKTGKGEYGEGDQFIGLTVPQQRKIAKKYKNLSLEDIGRLLRSTIHEFRFTALVILVQQYKVKREEKYVDLYVRNKEFVNNWDLVDTSAPYVLGDYLLDKDRSLLFELAYSNGLWDKRISILSTFAFIKNNDFTDAIKIAEILLNDEHDLIHKAVGWMLREIGNRDREVEEEFLRKYHKTMPRTMLRYAIEKFDEEKRKFYMKK